MATQDEIIDFIAEQLTVTPADIDPEQPLNQIKQEDLINLFGALIESYQIRFTTEERLQMKTMNDLVEQIEDKLLEI